MKTFFICTVCYFFIMWIVFLVVPPVKDLIEDYKGDLENGKE